MLSFLRLRWSPGSYYYEPLGALSPGPPNINEHETSLASPANQNTHNFTVRLILSSESHLALWYDCNGLLRHTTCQHPHISFIISHLSKIIDFTLQACLPRLLD